MRRMLIAACLVSRIGLAQESIEEGLPRAPQLFSFEKGTQAGLLLGVGIISADLFGGGDSLQTLEYTLEADIELMENIQLDLAAPAGTIFGDASNTVFGNVGLGLRGSTKGALQNGHWLAGGGLRLWLPTATDGDSSDLESLENVITLLFLDFQHLYDGGRFLPYYMTVRPTGSAAIVLGPLIAQMELGFDIFAPIDTDTGETNTLMHLGLAPGALLGSTAVYMEFTSIFSLQGDSLFESASNLALSVRSFQPTYTAGFALNLPLDPLNPGDALGFMMTVGGCF